MIVITGASGQLGRLVIRRLLEQVPGGDLVAAVRDPDKVADLADRGVVVRYCDYDDPTSVRAALRDAERVLLVSGNDIARVVAQHTAVIDAAQSARVGLLAYTSFRHADVSTLKVALPHRYTEPVIRQSGLPFTLLRNNVYTENLAPSIRQAVVSGRLVGSAGDGRVASATRADYAAAAAAVLTGEGHEHRTYELTGQVPWTMRELAEELSQITGALVVDENISSARHLELLLASGVPAVLAEAQVDTFRAIAAGQLAETSGDLVQLIGRSETSLHEAVGTILAQSVQSGRRP